jgi:hypothetical protein
MRRLLFSRRFWTDGRISSIEDTLSIQWRLNALFVGALFSFSPTARVRLYVIKVDQRLAHASKLTLRSDNVTTSGRPRHPQTARQFGSKPRMFLDLPDPLLRGSIVGCTKRDNLILVAKPAYDPHEQSVGGARCPRIKWCFTSTSRKMLYFSP